MERVTRQIRHVKRVCSNLADEMEQLRALRKLAYAIVALDEANIAAIGHLMSLKEELKAMLSHSSLEFVAGVCAELDRIVKKIGIAFAPLADALLERLMSMVASTHHDAVYNLLETVTQHSRFNLQPLCDVCSTLQPRSASRQQRALLAVVQCALVHWSTTELAPFRVALMGYLRSGLCSHSSDVRGASSSSFFFFSNHWSGAALDVAHGLKNHQRDALVQHLAASVPTAPITVKLQRAPIASALLPTPLVTGSSEVATALPLNAEQRCHGNQETPDAAVPGVVHVKEKVAKVSTQAEGTDDVLQLSMPRRDEDVQDPSTPSHEQLKETPKNVVNVPQPVVTHQREAYPRSWCNIAAAAGLWLCLAAIVWAGLSGFSPKSGKVRDLVPLYKPISQSADFVVELPSTWQDVTSGKTHCSLHDFSLNQSDTYLAGADKEKTASRATSTYPSAEQCSLREPYSTGDDPVRLQPHELVSAEHVPRTEQHHGMTDTSTPVVVQLHLDSTSTKTSSATTEADGNLMWLVNDSTCQTTGGDESGHTEDLTYRASTMTGERIAIVLIVIVLAMIFGSLRLRPIFHAKTRKSGQRLWRSRDAIEVETVVLIETESDAPSAEVNATFEVENSELEPSTPASLSVPPSPSMYRSALDSPLRRSPRLQLRSELPPMSPMR